MKTYKKAKTARKPNYDALRKVKEKEKYSFHLMACRRDELPDDRTGELVGYLADGC